jgi:hemolysin III
VLSIAGAIVLIVRVVSQGDAWRVAGCSIFATTLVFMYAASTLSHSFSIPRLRCFFRSLDQGSIYLLIAGSYTPLALAFLRTGWWWLLLGLMWTAALCGFVSKILFTHRVDAVAIWTFVLLGWTPILSAYWLLTLVPVAALWWMFAGGLCYTVGTVFLSYDDRHAYWHAIWHLFVVAGSACHFFAILLFAASMPSNLL